MKIAEVESKGLLPPKKRENGLFPGTLGRPCRLEVNHFKLKMNFKSFYQYSIQIVAPWRRQNKSADGNVRVSKRDKDLNRQVFLKWQSTCVEVKHMAATQFAFNGNNIFYCAERIQQDVKDMHDIMIQGDNKELNFNVVDVKLVEVINVTDAMNEFLQRGREVYNNEIGHPQDALMALDVILQQSVQLDKSFRSVGRCYFHARGEVLDIGFGKEVWVGTFAAARPFGWKNAGYLTTLNVDVANKPATISCHLTKESKPGAADSYIHRVLVKNPRLNFNSGLSGRDIELLNYDMKGLKVEYQLPDGRRRSYKVNEIMPSARELIIPDLKKSVEQYFRETYKVRLDYPKIPCLHLGDPKKTIYIPVEMCWMLSQPMPRGRKLPDDAVAKMIKQTAAPPDVRRRKILENLQQNNQMYANDPTAKQFGISIEQQMIKLQGRILPPPSIEYKNSMEQKIDEKKPGSWRPGKQHKYVDGKRLKSWAVLDLCNLSDRQYKDILQCFKSVGAEVGINISINDSDMWHQISNERDAVKHFKEILDAFKKDGLKLELVLVVLPFKGSRVYDTIKKMGDIEFKVPTQFVIQRNLFWKGSLNRQVISNLCLKINSKLGGVNHVLHVTTRPPVLNEPVMIMGADVSHPAPDSKGVKPSIAAVVGSVEPRASVFECEIRIQSAEQNEEIIQDMRGVTKSLLMKFFKRNGYKPKKIFMFRDGVSEGQFLKVLKHELLEMRAACTSLEEGYEPAITYLVVQKRHHTRIFSNDNNRYRNGNVLAGTVVDQGINHPKEGDFFLVSHEGIQGTSKPTHYQVLWDDNEMTADQLEQLAYYLCHLYARCTRSVSYPAPTYYSHLAADRARKHHNDMSDRHEKDIKKKIEKGDINVMHYV